MPNEYPRSHRVADFIQRELSVLMRSELKDPRVSPMLTISSVDVSRDLAYAKVYYTVMDDSDRAETQEALERAAAFLRRKLASRINTRSVPALRFYYDNSLEHGAHMSAIIAEAVASNTTQSDDPSDSTSADQDSGNPLASGSVPPSSGDESGFNPLKGSSEHD